MQCSSGEQIPIEERSEDEVLYQTGLNKNGDIEKILIAPENSKALNPAFDVTPHKYITAYITEKGIIKPNRLNLLKDLK